MTSAKIHLHHHCLIKARFRENTNKGHERRGTNGKLWRRRKERERERRSEVSGHRSHQNVLRRPNFILASSHFKEDRRRKCCWEFGEGGRRDFSSVTVIGDESKPELKLTFSKSFDKWKARCLFRWCCSPIKISSSEFNRYIEVTSMIHFLWSQWAYRAPLSINVHLKWSPGGHGRPSVWWMCEKGQTHTDTERIFSVSKEFECEVFTVPWPETFVHCRKLNSQPHQAFESKTC